MLTSQQEETIKVLVVGHTGAGKSTLLNLLMGKDILSEKGNLNCVNEFFKTSSKAKSETKECTISEIINLKDGIQCKFLDNPGLLDSRIDDRIYNILKSEKLIKNQKIILMIVFEAESISVNRGETIFKTFQSIYQIYKGILPESAFFVITKFNSDDHDKNELIDKVVEIIQDRSKENINELNENEIKTLIDFIKNIKNIHTFTKPSRKIVGKCKEHEEEKNSIHQTISQLTPQLHTGISLKNIKLDPETEHIINTKLPEQLQQLKQPFNKLIVQNLIQNIILNFEQSQDKKYLNLKQLYETKFENQITKYEEYLEELQQQQQINDSEKSEIIYTYNKINELSIFIKEKQQKSILLIDELSSMIQNKITSNKSDLVFQGYFLQSSKLQELLQQFKQKFVIIKTEYFIADSNLEYNGGNLFIKCNKFIVEQNCKYNLSGLNEVKILKAKNKDGQPGNPGHPGGNFILISNEISTTLDDLKLEIYLSGGQGGDGQDGGDGKDGCDGEDALTQDIESRSDQYIVHAEDVSSRVVQYLSLNKTFKIYYEKKGKPGQNGSDALKGGCPGHQGIHGQAIILNHEGKNLESKIISITKSQKIGQYGSHGKVGRGGNYGRTACAIFEDEYIFPTLRGITSDMEKKSDQEITSDGAWVNTTTTATITAGAIAAGEYAVASSVVTLARFVALPIGIAASGLQLVGSAISSSGQGKYIKCPYLQQVKTKAQDGKTPESFNCNNIKYPISNNINCLNDQEFCNLICINDIKCTLKQQSN